MELVAILNRVSRKGLTEKSKYLREEKEQATQISIFVLT